MISDDALKKYLTLCIVFIERSLTPPKTEPMHNQPLIVRLSFASPLRAAGWCVVEARPQVLAIFGLRFAVGAALAWPPAGGQLIRACETGLIWELAVFFVYLFNGVTDVKEDRANGSTRPIARGVLDPAAALLVSFCAALTALLGALALGGPTTFLVALLLVLGYLYSGPPCYLKRRSASTAAIGIAGGMLSYVAGLTGAASATTSHATVTLASFAVGASLWMGLTGTLAKDLPDVAGDTAAGRNSAVARLGDRKARILLCVTALAIAAIFNLTALTASHTLWAGAAAMLVGAIALSAITHSRRSQGSRRERRLPYRVFMHTQYAIHMCVLVPILWHVIAGK